MKVYEINLKYVIFCLYKLPNIYLTYLFMLNYLPRSPASFDTFLLGIGYRDLSPIVLNEICRCRSILRRFVFSFSDIPWKT